LKEFVMQNFYFIETQAMVIRQAVVGKDTRHLDDTTARELHELFLDQLRILTHSERVFNLWESANLRGLSGPQSSARSKALVVDVIVDLYDKFESERTRKFLSTAVTGILSAWSSWHTTVCEPDQPIDSLEGRRVLDLYGGDSQNFPVRVCFISNDKTVLLGFLALCTYLQRSLVFVKNHRPTRTKFRKETSVNLSELEVLGFSGRMISAITTSVSVGTYSILVDDMCATLRSTPSSDTLTSSSTDTTELDTTCPRYCSMFVDYHKINSRIMTDIVPGCLPVISDQYHPALPIMGLPATDGVIRDRNDGISAFHNALQLSIPDGITQKMVLSDAQRFDTWHMVPGDQCQVAPASSISRILRNFKELKQLTGNSKLCLYYLETELQSLAYIRKAYLTFWSLDSSPPEKFLEIFKLKDSDGQFFNLIKK